jgi:hypothetical protein
MFLICSKQCDQGSKTPKKVESVYRPRAKASVAEVEKTQRETPAGVGGTGAGASIVGAATQQNTHAARHPGYEFASATA